VGILIKLLFFIGVYHYLKIEAAIAVLLIWLAIRQMRHDSPIWNFILSLIVFAITVIYLAIFFEFHTY